MTRKKFDILDVIAALIVGVILGIFATFCFSSPSSEASSCSLRTGFIDRLSSMNQSYSVPVGVDRDTAPTFIESISNPADSMFIGVGSPPQPAPTFTDSKSAAALPISPETWAQAGFPARRLIVTAYCQNSCCCGEFADGYTASGHKIRPGDCFVAAPPEYPFGTKLSIPGYAGGSMVSVLDRGGKIKGNRLDVFFGGKDGHEKALAWGVQKFEVAQ